jgi:hypothetical protein
VEDDERAQPDDDTVTRRNDGATRRYNVRD